MPLHVNDRLQGNGYAIFRCHKTVLQPLTPAPPGPGGAPPYQLVLIIPVHLDSFERNLLMSMFGGATLITGLVTAPWICLHSLQALTVWVTLWAMLVRLAHLAETR